MSDRGSKGLSQKRRMLLIGLLQDRAEKSLPYDFASAEERIWECESCLEAALLADELSCRGVARMLRERAEKVMARPLEVDIEW